MANGKPWERRERAFWAGGWASPPAYRTQLGLASVIKTIITDLTLGYSCKEISMLDEKTRPW